MGNFAENLNLGNRFRPPPRRENSSCYGQLDQGRITFRSSSKQRKTTKMHCNVLKQNINKIFI